MPSLLDFCMRTNNTPFYHMFHSRSHYNHLLILVLCTWVPLITSYIIGRSFPQNETDPNLCDSLETSMFLHILGMASLFLLLIISRVYILIMGLAKNRKVRDSAIQRFNQILWVETVTFFIATVFFLMKSKLAGIVVESAWEAMNARRFGIFVVVPLIDVVVCALIPPTAPKLEKVFEKIT